METIAGDLPLNDETDYGLCFACGPRHPSGLRLNFESDGHTVSTSFLTSEAHQGFPGYVHGGIISAILDEVMSRVSLLEDRWTMTARMEVRFRRPVPLDHTIAAEAEKSGESRGFLKVKGRVMLADGTVAADAVGTYAFLSGKALARIAAGYPRLAREWMPGGGKG